MPEPELKDAIARLEELKVKIAADRNALRDALDEYEGILDSCNRALEDLESAISNLSEYV